MYFGIDLQATSMQICVIDRDLNRLLKRYIRNDLPTVIALLKPFRKGLSIRGERTFKLALARG